MSIPNSRYYRNRTRGISVTSKKAGVVKEAIITPVLLHASYPNKATLMQIFHLDFVKEMPMEKAGGVEFSGLVCGVLLTEVNIQMRRAERLSGLMEAERLTGFPDQRHFMILTDPFRTYAKLLAGIGYKLSYPVKIDMYVKSNFFFETTDYGFEAKVNGGPLQVISYGPLAANAIHESQKTLDFSLGDFVEIRAYAINDEGPKYMPWQSAYVRPDEYSFRYSRVNNGDGTMTFTVQLFPLAMEVPLAITFAQGYSGSPTISYCTVTIPAGQTTASNTLTLIGSPLALYGVSSHHPSQLSDLTPVVDNGELATKYRIHLRLSDYDDANYAQVFIEVYDDDGTTSTDLPTPINIDLRISGNTESGAYSETLTVNHVEFAFEERDLYLNYESGDTLWSVSFTATATPPILGGREIVFTYQT